MSKQKNGSVREAVKVLLYEAKDGEVELRVDSDSDTLWATQEQIAQLFEVTISNVSLHIINIFNSKELSKNSVIKESLITAKDGKQYKAILYNLDVIIAVGYRVNSKKATQFRIWATRILRKYAMSGYVLNERKLSGNTDKIEDVYDTLDYLESPHLKGKLKGKITLRVTKDLL